MSRGSYTCSHWRQLASAQLDDELAEFESIGLERHRAECSACAAWMRELGHLADAIRTSERTQPREPVVVRRLRSRARHLPALAAASASIGAAVLVAIAIGLPRPNGSIQDRALTGIIRDASVVDAPPRSLVLASYIRAQRLAARPPAAAPYRRPYGAP